MNKFIDAEKLIAEIERRLQENSDKALVFGAAFAGRTAEDNDLKNLVTSLQQEQPEVDLEKEIEEHVEGMPMSEFTHESEVDDFWGWARKEFRYFFERGLNARKV